MTRKRERCVSEHEREQQEECEDDIFHYFNHVTSFVVPFGFLYQQSTLAAVDELYYIINQSINKINQNLPIILLFRRD